MDLILQPSAAQCAVTGLPFQEDDRVVCFLGRDATGAVVRWDVRADAEAQFAPPADVICRWVHAFKARVRGDDSERNLKLTAENLFLTLCDPAAEPDPANTPLIQFLALMLERKRLLKPRGVTPDRAHRIYEYMKTKQVFEVPAGELTAEFFRKVQEQLGVLVGEPKKVPVTLAASAPATEGGPSGGGAALPAEPGAS
jgi:hypothetical protein